MPCGLLLFFVSLIFPNEEWLGKGSINHHDKTLDSEESRIIFFSQISQRLELLHFFALTCPSSNQNFLHPLKIFNFKVSIIAEFLLVTYSFLITIREHLEISLFITFLELQYLHPFILFIIIELTIIESHQLLLHVLFISFSLIFIILIASFFITVVASSFFPILF